MKKIALFLCVVVSIASITAQNKNISETPSPIIFIYDASGSMWGQMQGKSKMEIASSVLSDVVSTLPENQNMGLVAYGHREKSNCRDVETLVEMSNSSKTTIISAIKKIQPLGKTPLAYSAKHIIDKLRISKEKATIILITDGVETCDGNICTLVAAAKKEGVDFKLHIVGFGLKEGETQQLECAAKAGGGMYYDASNANGLGEALEEVTEKTIDQPKGNHGVYAVKNGHPIDALVTAYHSGTKDEVDTARTYRDTSFVFLPQGTYDIEVRPLENTKLASQFFSDIKTFDDRLTYQTVSFDAGKIKLITTNNGENWDCTVKIINPQGKTVLGKRTYNRVNIVDIDPGVYSVVSSPLRIDGVETTLKTDHVAVEAGETQTVAHHFKTGIANLGVQENGALVDLVIGIYSLDKKISVVGRRSYTSSSSNPRKFELLPGKYAVKLRGKKNGADHTEWFEISVIQGESFTKMFEW